MSLKAEQGKLIFPCPRSRLRIWSRETGPAVPSRVSLLILHTQAESGAYSRGSSRVPRRCPFIYLKPPYAIGSVPSLSGHAIAYRWRSLPRVRRHVASKPQGSYERVLPWQVTMGHLLCACLSHIHYWYEVGMYVCIYGHTYSKSMDQPGKVANPARGQLNREKIIFPCPRSRLRIWSRETGSAVPSRVSLLILHTQAESGAYSRGSSRVPRRCPFIYLKPPYAIGSVPSLSGHAIAYRWRSLPRVRRRGASKPQRSNDRRKELLLYFCAIMTYASMKRSPSHLGVDAPELNFARAGTGNSEQAKSAAVSSCRPNATKVEGMDKYFNPGYRFSMR